MVRTKQTQPLNANSPAPSFRVVETPNAWRVVMPPFRFPALPMGLLFAVFFDIAMDWLKWKQSNSGLFDFAVYVLVGIPFILFTAGLIGLVIYILNRFDHDEIIIDERFLFLRQRYLGINHNNTFLPQEVRNVRLTRFSFWDGVKHSLRAKKLLKLAEVNSGAKSRALCFDYRGRIYQFGAGLDEVEARKLRALLQERLPL